MLSFILPRVRFYLRALGYFRSDLPRIALLLGLIGCSTVLGLLQVWPMALLVDSVMSPNPNQGWMYRELLLKVAESPPAQIAVLAGAMLAMRLVQEVLNMARGLLHLHVANAGMIRVRCDLFRKLQALHLRYHQSQPQGDSLYRLSYDTGGCQAILDVFINTSVAAVSLVVMLAVMLSRSLELTFVALAVAPLLLITNVRFGRILKRRTLAAKELESQFTSNVQRAMSSIGLVQAFGREATEFGRFHLSVTSSVSAWRNYHWQEWFYRFCVGLIFGGGGALIFGYGAYQVYRDQYLAPRPGGMTLGDLMVFLSYLAMFYDPLCKISGAGCSIQGASAGAERVFEVLDRDPVVSDRPGAIALPQQPRTLVLENVSFGYEVDRPVLRDVSVTVRPGEMVAFVGSSGVGKSTLLNLLPRFFDPTGGALRLDGQDLREVQLRDLRRHVALVLQESLILPTTVAENIAYGRSTATEAQIQQAAVMAGAAEFIEALPDGYNTRILDGGQNLSGGQRQRIAIARALLTEAPILVLDEPTSALDPDHEHQIVETLRSLKRQRTIVLVSHRLSTVVDCDQIFVMSEGRIVERGDHRGLLAQGGLYYRMARHQLQIGSPAELAAA